MRWYTGDATYDTLLAGALTFAVLVFAISWFLPSPYGRFASTRFGVSVDPRVGWFLMELPASLSFVYFFAQGTRRAEAVPLVFLCMWLAHYGNRGFYFPFSMRVVRGVRGSFSALVMVTGWAVTGLHGYFHATFFTRLGTHYTTAWLTDPRFIVGLLAYYACFALNLQSDAIIRNLRTREELDAGTRVYRIPRGGLFRWVTSPSYLTELGAWAGFALCTWSLAGLFIFLVSAGNLVPRAHSTHRWYRERFPDYPPERKALIPFVW
ncbi:MAG: 3-oxo-5-alpha-steroid 4-dehydrogenase [Deltaproteobacteria bacterium]